MKKAIAVLSFFIACNSHAVWLNTAGKITSLTTYATTNTILVTLSNPGTDVEQCSNKTTFAISKDINAEARARMYSMLLAAQTSDRTVTVSYNDVGNCEPWDANLNAYRKITRLR